MPQVDLETLVSSVCSDRKITCETLANDNDDNPKILPPDPPVDFPPESYSLSEEAQIEWLTENAFFERKESQKGNSNSNSNHIPNSNPNHSNNNSSSQRISLKSKASIIRLPKPQKTFINEAGKKRRNCRIARTLMIPKRIGSRLKSDPSLSEPCSPKVSCIGRVRSKRDRSRRMQRQRSVRIGSVKEKPVRVKKPGFFASFRAIFRTGGGCKDLSASEAHAPNRDDGGGSQSSDIRGRLPKSCSSPTGSRKSVDEPVLLPGLGGMTRFTSGRRADLLT